MYILERGLKMKTLTATDARNEWFELLKKSVKGHQTYRITAKEGGDILLSEEYYESLIETLELLSVPGMSSSIKKADREVRENKTSSMKEIFGD